MDFQINHDKPAIIVDELLMEYGREFADKMAELSDAAEILSAGARRVCRLRDGGKVGGFELLELTWGHQLDAPAVGKEELKSLAYINNLDSVLDYDTFRLPIRYLFPLLECVRRGCAPRTVYFVGAPPDAEVYLL